MKPLMLGLSVHGFVVCAWSRPERLRRPRNVARSRRVGCRYVIAPQLAAFRGPSHGTETQAGVKPSNHVVFLGRNIDAGDPADPTDLALFDQSVKHGEFQFALQNATTHQPNT